MFEAGSVIADLIVSLLELLIEIVRHCLKFVLRGLGYSDTRGTKVISRIGWISLALLIGFLIFLTIKFS